MRTASLPLRWDAYEEAYEKWYAVENRNYIRQSLKDTEYNITTYNLSRYEARESLTKS